MKRRPRKHAVRGATSSVAGVVALAPKRESAKSAEFRLLNELEDRGWTTRLLGQSWAEPPGGAYRILFRGRGVQMDGRSLGVDIRGLSVDALIHAAENKHARSGGRR
jgi:hypothetical protein